MESNNVTDMSGMFYCCELLLSLPDITNWNINNVIKMHGIFSHLKINNIIT